MRTIAIKMKNYTNEMSIINNNIEKFVLNIMLWSFGMLALLYILFLGNMVFNIVERRNLEKDMHILSSEVLDLELNYLSMSSELDLNFSHTLGFLETEPKFTTRQSLGFINPDGIKFGTNEI